MALLGIPRILGTGTLSRLEAGSVPLRDAGCTTLLEGPLDCTPPTSLSSRICGIRASAAECPALALQLCTVCTSRPKDKARHLRLCLKKLCAALCRRRPTESSSSCNPGSSGSVLSSFPHCICDTRTPWSRLLAKASPFPTRILQEGSATFAEHVGSTIPLFAAFWTHEMLSLGNFLPRFR